MPVKFCPVYWGWEAEMPFFFFFFPKEIKPVLGCKLGKVMFLNNHLFIPKSEDSLIAILDVPQGRI